MKRTGLALMVAALALAPLAAWATPEGSGAGRPAMSEPLADSNALETRELHFHNMRLPGNFSSHQEVTAWQVTQGSWNGQSLAGLSLVMVQSIADDGRSAPRTNCYISEFATSAQKQALITAFTATNPGAVCTGEVGSLHVEPAVITLQLEGQTLTLHLGLVA